MKNYSSSDLELLGSTKGLKYLLSAKTLEFEKVLERLRFDQELSALQARLIQIQNKILKKDKRILILFEGREFAGKGRSIDAFTEHLNPRNIRRVALDKPTENQMSQWYFKRYIEKLPEPGEMVFFDRSWYNRAVIEPVNNFCTKREYKRFMKEVLLFEEMLVEDGMVIVKLYLDISREVQSARIKDIQSNPLERWQLSSIDLEAVHRYDQYTTYIQAMLKKTHSKKTPWKVIQADDIQGAVIEAMQYVIEVLK